MDRRYQVFVSSTYDDLQVERAEVMHALLGLKCFPAGMELFPATDDDQWTTIKRVIDECDYYMVIVGGRYGSVAEDGISYTEKEYRYALEKGKPIMGFLHKNPGSISLDRSEQTPEARSKLDHFRELIKKKLCKFWTTPSDLAALVSQSISQMIFTKPSPGWVRAIELDQEIEGQELFLDSRSVERFLVKTESVSDSLDILPRPDTIRPNENTSNSDNQVLLQNRSEFPLSIILSQLNEISLRVRLLRALDDGALYIEGENLTERQIIILELLRHRGPLTVTLIGAHFASVSLGIISKEINRLWRGDFVSKEIRREDQRTFIVDLTDKGRRIIDSVRRQRSKEIVTLLQAMAISEEERKLFSNVLNRINSQLEKNLVERI